MMVRKLQLIVSTITQLQQNSNAKTLKMEKSLTWLLNSYQDRCLSLSQEPQTVDTGDTTALGLKRFSTSTVGKEMTEMEKLAISGKDTS